MDVTNLREKLVAHHQEHLLKFWEDPEMTQENRQQLYDDLMDVNYAEMNIAFEKSTGKSVAHNVTNGVNGNSTNGAHDVNDQLSNAIPVNEKMQPLEDEMCGSIRDCGEEDLEKFRNLTLEHIAKGHIGVLLLAGGQGTRLGVPYPKGMYKIGLPSGKTLYQVQAERVLRLQEMAREKTGLQDSVITMYVMTSEHTMAPTVKFFEEHNFFGLKRENLVFFEQRMIPCFDENGKIILETKSKLARAPDGNGGLYWALKNEKTLDHMESRGIRYLHVYCVDNVLVKVADPVFMGYCIQKEADAGNKVVEKVFPNEAVGVVCKVDGKYQVVEYSEIGTKNAEMRTKDNKKLLYNAGNICNHFYTTTFLKNICLQHDQKLPYHVANKKIPSVGGGKVAGIKLEKFVFDVFCFTDKFVVWECKREEEFSPLKNADGAAKDTPLTARTDLFKLHKTYFENAGGKINSSSQNEDDVVECEISPLLSYAGENLSKRAEGKVYTAKQVLIDVSGDKCLD